MPTDKERLDWLESRGFPGQFQMTEKGWFDFETEGSDYSPTLRAAIDAAIEFMQLKLGTKAG